MQIPTNSSRLVRFLTELGAPHAAVSHERFAERLGRLFDLPDSIRISAVHARIRSMAFEPSTVSGEEIKAEFLRVRASMVNSVLQSFVPGGGSRRLRFPEVAAQMTLEQTMTAEPYLAFYAARQRDIDVRVRNLHAATREGLAGVSTRLAQLAALDAALGDPLSIHNRRFFSAVCPLLRKRIEFLLEQYRLSVSSGPHGEERWANTRARLRAEMQGLLLAELETRLLPTLGLIEALDEHEDE